MITEVIKFKVYWHILYCEYTYNSLDKTFHVSWDIHSVFIISFSYLIIVILSTLKFSLLISNIYNLSIQKFSISIYLIID